MPSLVHLTDTDGDPVAVLAWAIVAVTIGRAHGRSRAEGQAADDATVVHTNGGRLVVRESMNEVLARWRGAVAYEPTAEHAGAGGAP